MNSPDPWRTIVTDPHGDVVLPRPHYGHPLYGLCMHGRPFVGAEASGTVSGWVDIGANMTNIIGAELTALSVPGYAWPGYGYGHPYGYGYGSSHPYGGVLFGAEAPTPPIPGAPVVATPAGAPPVAPPVVVPVAPGSSVAKADPGRTGLLAEIAPIMAPATGEIAVKKELDARQVLHVEICVDGKCYKTSMDLAPALELVMKKLLQWHEGTHAPPPPPTVVQAVERAIGAATHSMVGVMVGHHVAVMTSGWLSDIGNAIGSTLRKLQPVISTVATGVATAYGGPAAGAAAGKLAPVITNYQADALDPKGNPQKKAAARQALARINQAAANDPDPAAAQAVAAANQAVKNTTVAYHVKETAEQAAAGNPTAQTDINNLVQAAEEGDPAAKSTYEVLALTFAQEMMKSEEGAKLWEKVTGRGPGTISPLASSPASSPTPSPTAASASGWYDVGGGTIVGGFWSSVKDGLLKVTLVKQTNQFIKDNKLEPYVQLAANAISSYYGGPAGVAASNVVTPMMMKVGVQDEQESADANQRLQRATAVAQQHPQMAQAVEIAKGAAESAAVAYQVAQLTKDARAGNPEAQQALSDLQAAAARGDEQAAAALQAAAVIDQEQQKPPDMSAGPVNGPSVNGEWFDIAGTVIGMEAAGATAVGCRHHTALGGWYDIIGAALDDVREKARAHAVTKPGSAAGVLITVDGRLHGRGFRNLDDAIDWLQHITRERTTFTYAAAYEKDADGAAYIQAEELGATPQPEPFSTTIPQEAPATTAG